MNRSVTQTARVLGTTPSQVKAWTFTFKDFLSRAANPPKGTARMFNDSDVLALVYIAAHWDAKPDLNSIRIGLRDDAHHAQEFREHLYLHTSLLQEPPEDLDETWRHGFLLCGAGGQHFLELARNYRHVAENLLETALASGSPLDHAYPVLFAYRHTLELYLKIVGEIDEATHSLARCVRLVEQRYGHSIGRPVRDWILELDKMDPTGTAFRYAGAESVPLRYAEFWLDLVQFRFAMNRVFLSLDNAILHLRSEGKPVKKHAGKAAAMPGVARDFGKDCADGPSAPIRVRPHPSRHADVSAIELCVTPASQKSGPACPRR